MSLTARLATYPREYAAAEARSALSSVFKCGIHISGGRPPEESRTRLHPSAVWMSNAEGSEPREVDASEHGSAAAKRKLARADLRHVPGIEVIAWSAPRVDRFIASSVSSWRAAHRTWPCRRWDGITLRSDRHLACPSFYQQLEGASTGLDAMPVPCTPLLDKLVAPGFRAAKRREDIEAVRARGLGQFAARQRGETREHIPSHEWIASPRTPHWRAPLKRAFGTGHARGVARLFEQRRHRHATRLDDETGVAGKDSGVLEEPGSNIPTRPLARPGGADPRRVRRPLLFSGVSAEAVRQNSRLSLRQGPSGRGTDRSRMRRARQSSSRAIR